MTSRYKSIFFAVSLLFLAGALSSPWCHAGQRSIFTGIPTEADCRLCHGDTDDTATTVALHHILTDTEIPEWDESTAPDAPNAVPGEPYECLSCHDMSNWTSDCLQCHPVWIVTGPPGRGDNVHHDTFGHSNCGICHSD